MTPTLTQAFKKNFLGNSPGWYEAAIIAFLLINPICLYLFGPFVTGWMLIGEFIFTWPWPSNATHCSPADCWQLKP